MADKKPNSGVLNVAKDKLNDRSPDFWGNITLDPDLIKYLLQRSARGEEAKLSLSAWKKTGPYGGFLSLSVSEPKKPTGSAPPPRRAPTEEFDNIGDDDIPF